MGWQTVNEKVA